MLGERPYCPPAARPPEKAREDNQAVSVFSLAAFGASALSHAVSFGIIRFPQMDMLLANGLLGNRRIRWQSSR